MSSTGSDESQLQSYSSTYSISTFQDGNSAAVLDQNLGTPQAGHACPDNADVWQSASREKTPKHLRLSTVAVDQRWWVVRTRGEVSFHARHLPVWATAMARMVSLAFHDD